MIRNIQIGERGLVLREHESTQAAPSLIEKMHGILAAFDEENPELTLTGITERCDVPKASVHRLATQLVEAGYLEKRDVRYRLGLRLFELGQLVPRQRILKEAAGGYLQELGHVSQETVHLAIRQGLEVLFVEKIDAIRGQVGHISRVAARFPLHSTATGKVLLAFAGKRTFAQVASNGLEPVTRRTITSALVLGQQLARVRSEKLAREVEETRLGFMSIAVPIQLASGAVPAAVSITGPVSRMQVVQPRHIQALQRAAAGIAARLQNPHADTDPSDSSISLMSGDRIPPGVELDGRANSQRKG